MRTGEMAAKHLFGATDWAELYARDPGLAAVYDAGMMGTAARLGVRGRKRYFSGLYSR